MIPSSQRRTAVISTACIVDVAGERRNRRGGRADATDRQRSRHARLSLDGGAVARRQPGHGIFALHGHPDRLRDLSDCRALRRGGPQPGELYRLLPARGSLLGDLDRDAGRVRLPCRRRRRAQARFPGHRHSTVADRHRRRPRQRYHRDDRRVRSKRRRQLRLWNQTLRRGEHCELLVRSLRYDVDLLEFRVAAGRGRGRFQHLQRGLGRATVHRQRQRTDRRGSHFGRKQQQLHAFRPQLRHEGFVLRVLHRRRGRCRPRQYDLRRDPSDR